MSSKINIFPLVALGNAASDRAKKFGFLQAFGGSLGQVADLMAANVVRDIDKDLRNVKSDLADTEKLFVDTVVMFAKQFEKNVTESKVLEVLKEARSKPAADRAGHFYQTITEIISNTPVTPE